MDGIISSQLFKHCQECFQKLIYQHNDKHDIINIRDDLLLLQVKPKCRNLQSASETQGRSAGPRETAAKVLKNGRESRQYPTLNEPVPRLNRMLVSDWALKKQSEASIYRAAQRNCRRVDQNVSFGGQNNENCNDKTIFKVFSFVYLYKITKIVRAL